MLQNDGWSVSPNFHFGFMAAGICWTTTTMPLTDYLCYWQANIRNTAQVDREHWDGYWQRLVETGIAKLTDREDFDRQFTNTSRQTASPRPGIGCTFVWPVEEAERLDDRRSQFKKSIKERINQLLESVSEEKLAAA
jgi:hypothetical protein